MEAPSNRQEQCFSGINVTPLVDITLVLLIIFMVTAKLIVSQTVPMDLPRASSGAEQQVVLALAISADGATTVDSTRVVSDDQILSYARNALGEHPELRAVIQADTSTSHGKVVHTMDLLRQAGIGKIAFGIQPIVQQSGPSRN